MNDNATTQPETARRDPKGGGYLMLRRRGKWHGDREARRFKDGTWYACFTADGGKVRESSHSGSRSRAADLLRDRLKEVADGRFVRGAARVTLGQLRDLVVADYERNGRRSADDVRGRFKSLERLIGEKATADRIRQRIPGYVAARLKEPKRTRRKPRPDGAQPDAEKVRLVSRATVNRELAVLRRGFRLAVNQGLLAVAPAIEMLRQGPPRKGFPEPEEVEAIIRRLPERLRGAVRLLAITGWRVREALNLEWRSLREGTIRLERDETKGGEIRVYPYAEHPELAALIRAQRAAADAIEAGRRAMGDITPVSHVFCKPDGSPNRAYQHSWNDACLKAGYPGRLVHDLRRYAARNLIRAGVTEVVAMGLLGHRTPSVFRRYNVTDERDLRQAVKHLARAEDERRTASRANA